MERVGGVRGIQRDLEKSSGFAWLSRPQPASEAKDTQTASVFITEPPAGREEGRRDERGVKGGEEERRRGERRWYFQPH